MLNLPREHVSPTDGSRGPVSGANPARLVVLVALTIGVGLRVLEYAAGRSVWLDEALLLENVLHRPVEAMATALSHGQSAAPGYALLLWSIGHGFGANEYALRLPSLLAALASLGLFWTLAVRCLSRAAANIALVLFVLCPYSVYYASEAKPYSIDVLATLVALNGVAAFRRADERPNSSVAWQYLPLALALTLIWFSQPAALVLAGVFGVGLVDALRRRESAQALAWIGGLAALGLASATAYLTATGGSDREYLMAFWASGFPDISRDGLVPMGWFVRALLRMLREPLGPLDSDFARNGFWGPFAAFTAIIAGAGGLRTRNPILLAFLVAPIGMALGAAVLRLYPFGAEWFTGGRVLLFLVPCLLLLAAEGLDALWRAGPSGRALAVIAGAVALVQPAVHLARAFPHPRSEIRPVLAHVRRHWKPGDVLYVHHELRSAFRFYQLRYGFRHGDIRTGVCAQDDPARYLRDLERLREAPRVWSVFATSGIESSRDEASLMRGYLDLTGSRVYKYVTPGTAAYLHNFRAAGPDHPSVRLDVRRSAERSRFSCRGPYANEAV